MAKHRWDPTCTRPDGVVEPVRVDRSGDAGPTPGQARGPHWRRCAPGWYVPACAPDVVEQRIVEQAARLGPHGGVTAWAALRWYGAAFFDGTDEGGRRRLPVPLLVGTDLRPAVGSWLSFEQFAPTERVVVDGVPCASVQRALFDEMRRTRRLWPAVRSADMAAAAGLISVRLMRAYVENRYAWTGAPLVRKALGLASDDSRSPQETTLRLVWVVVARLPPPLCNRPVFSLDGRLLGTPDLFDPEAGLVGEYDGAEHLLDDRRRSDTTREERFRDHGLEYFRVVKGELGETVRVANRMHRARERAAFVPPGRRRWTLDPPPGYSVPEPLHDRLMHAGLAASLTHA